MMRARIRLSGGIIVLYVTALLVHKHAVFARGGHKVKSKKKSKDGIKGKSKTKGKSKSSDTNFGSRPNILHLIVDDWGGGDVDMCDPSIDYVDCPYRPMSRGRKQILHTPRIRQMAREGQIMTNFYSPRSICTPSRAGYLSGRDPSRYGLSGPIRILLSSGSRGGFSPSEKTWAEYLQELDYNTGYTGKWHLGLGNGIDPFHYGPVAHGFDEAKFFIEGSNGEQCESGGLNPPGDNNIYHMCSYDHIHDCDKNNAGDICEIVEQPIRWENVTARHLKATLDMIKRYKDDEKPWAITHAFTQVHVPWVPSRHMVTDPKMKFFTDTVGEVDWAVGTFMKYIKEDEKLAENTIVLLTSDNGPYMESASSLCPQNCKFSTPEWQRTHGEEGVNVMCTVCDSDTVSLPGISRGGKGNTWEGGQRTPAIAWWPGKIRPNTVNPVVASGLDFLPTIVALAGGEPDDSIAIDGRDLSPFLFSHPHHTDKPEGTFVYWCGNTIFSVRIGQYKVLWWRQNFVGKSADNPTPGYLCAGTGDCCVGSPSRLCICDWSEDYRDEPRLINLIEDPTETDFVDPHSKKYKEILEKASKIREDRMRSTVTDRDLPNGPDLTYDEMEQYIMADPVIHPLQDFCLPLGDGTSKNEGNAGSTKTDLMESIREFPFYCNMKWWDGTDEDLYIPMGCDVVPEECREHVKLPGEGQVYYPYSNCSIAGTYAGVDCQRRFPCCQQDDYAGPFEYIVPDDNKMNWDDFDNTIQCGCFKAGANSLNGQDSYFPGSYPDKMPDDLDELIMGTLCDWHDDVDMEAKERGLKEQRFCRLPQCVEEGKEEENEELCHEIATYGLSTIPTGNMFNSPYPDTQTNEALRYTNTKPSNFPPH